MLLPQFTRISREDLGQGVPNWVDKIIGPINDFMNQCWIAFNNNITIGQNVTGSIQTLTIQTPTDYGAPNYNFPNTVFSWPFTKPVQAVLIAAVRQTSGSNQYVIQHTPVFLDWQQLSANQVKINYVSGLLANTQYNVTIMAL